MIEFFSASTRMVNSKRAMQECLESAFGEGASTDCQVIMIHASIGHNYAELMAAARELAPSATIVGASCCGIVGSEGVSESMKDLAIMAMRCDPYEIVVSHVDDMYGHNAEAKARQLAVQALQQNPTINMVYFLASGIDIDNDAAIAGIEAEMGEEVTIFGATSSDNMRGLVSYQLAGDKVMQHGAFLVGFADPSLEVITQATHGFVAVGEPMTVTKSDGHNIYELNGQPAWSYFTDTLGLDPKTASCGDTIPIGALAEALPDDLRKEYGNDHILRVVTSHDGETMHYATACPVGTKLWLTTRDEDVIFSEAARMMQDIDRAAAGRKPVAVFHADCLARGRFSLGKIMKEELVHQMQYPLSNEGKVPPWIGMYGFGEFARLGGKNTYHNYTSALYAIYKTA